MELLTLKRVLAAIDLDGSFRAAVTSARDLAMAAGAELHLLHVAGIDAQRSSVERELQQIGIPMDDAQLHLSVGDPTRAINLTADKIKADVIVLGPHREMSDGPRASGLGSTALAVVTNAAVPCLVTARALRLPLEHVVAAIDLSDTARGTLRVALSWASALRARRAEPTLLTALHVMRAPSPEQTAARSRALEDALAPIHRAAGSWAGVELRTEIVPAENPADGVTRYAETQSAGLVAIGTHGLGVDPIGRTNSVSDNVMRRIVLPILLVPPAMWNRPAS
jgi:nucleotide-binding universal stress UspA family protein